MALKAIGQVKIANYTYDVVINWRAMEILEAEEDRPWLDVFGLDPNTGVMNFNPTAHTLISLLVAGLAKRHRGVASRSKIIDLLDEDERPGGDIFGEVYNVMLPLIMRFMAGDVPEDVVKEAGEDQRLGEGGVPADKTEVTDARH